LPRDSFYNCEKNHWLRLCPLARNAETIAKAHSDLLQKCFDARNLSCGVQWEIARLITLQENPDDFSTIPINLLDHLQGSNAQSAPKTAKLILEKIHAEEAGDVPKDANARERSAKVCLLDSPQGLAYLVSQAPWKELDIEEVAYHNNPEGGLGFNPDFPNWHGGKVHFRARLKNVGTTKMPRYRVILERAVLGPSCLFTRRFMSKRFLTIKVPKQILNNTDNGLFDLFLRPFILTGRVFRAWFAKDDNVFMVETDEILDGNTISASRRPASPTGPCSLEAFLEWHNPINRNTNQVCHCLLNTDLHKFKFLIVRR
jgi:RNA-dependent RNA polymerase